MRPEPSHVSTREVLPRQHYPTRHSPSESQARRTALRRASARKSVQRIVQLRPRFLHWEVRLASLSGAPRTGCRGAAVLPQDDCSISRDSYWRVALLDDVRVVRVGCVGALFQRLEGVMEKMVRSSPSGPTHTGLFAADLFSASACA